MSLFGDRDGPGAEAYSDEGPIPDLEFDKAQRLKFEKEMLGLYVSDHPLMGAEGMLRRAATAASRTSRSDRTASR